jgi:antitoxin VapB
MTGPRSSTIVTKERGQVLRLPKAIAFPDDMHRVVIIELGRSRLIVPAAERRDELLLNGPRSTDDFLFDRDRPGGA